MKKKCKNKQIEFQNKNNEQNKFFKWCNKILLIKQKTLLKKTNPIKILFAQSARARFAFQQLYCSFELPQTFQFFHSSGIRSHNFIALLNYCRLSSSFISSGLRSHNFIALLNCRRLSSSFISSGIRSHNFIALLNYRRVSSSLISSGIRSQILWPINLILSVPLKTVHSGGM